MIKFAIGVIVGSALGRPALARIIKPLRPIIYRRLVLTGEQLMTEARVHMENKIWEEGNNR